MTKPTLIIKQQSRITTVKLKGVPFAYVVATNEDLAKHGIVKVIKAKIKRCKELGYNNVVGKYEMLLTALGA
jgi:hypothetical protein